MTFTADLGGLDKLPDCQSGHVMISLVDSQRWQNGGQRLRLIVCGEKRDPLAVNQLHDCDDGPSIGRDDQSTCMMQSVTF